MTSPVGGRRWWREHLRATSAFKIRENRKYHFFKVTNDNPRRVTNRQVSNEGKLKDELYRTNLFTDAELETKVLLGSARKQIDWVCRLDDSLWVIEFKLVQKGDVKIDIRQIGQAIGQVYALTYAYRRHSQERSVAVEDAEQRQQKEHQEEQQQHLPYTIMPAICVWSLGAGKDQVLDMCRMIGITVIEVMNPGQQAAENGASAASANIYYLDEGSPRPFHLRGRVKSAA